MVDNTSSQDVTSEETEIEKSFNDTKPERSMDTKLQVCSYCTEIVDESPVMARDFELTQDHLNYMLGCKDKLNCIFCELMLSAVPMNTMPEVKNENGPVAPFSLASMNLSLLKFKEDVIELRDDEPSRYYGTLVRTNV
jgi:hypothetical protein